MQCIISYKNMCFFLYFNLFLTLIWLMIDFNMVKISLKIVLFLHLLIPVRIEDESTD